MPDSKENEIVFIGKITASITHEIKNVLASIKELTGLMEDLVSMSDDFPLKNKQLHKFPEINNQKLYQFHRTKNRDL